LIGQPAECGEGHHSVSADHNQSAKAVANAWNPGLASIRTNAIFKDKMAAVDLDSNPITDESHNPMSRCDRCREIAAVRILRYGLRSYHGSVLSFGG